MELTLTGTLGLLLEWVGGRLDGWLRLRGLSYLTTMEGYGIAFFSFQRNLFWKIKKGKKV